MDIFIVIYTPNWQNLTQVKHWVHVSQLPLIDVLLSFISHNKQSECLN